MLENGGSGVTVTQRYSVTPHEVNGGASKDNQNEVCEAMYRFRLQLATSSRWIWNKEVKYKHVAPSVAHAADPESNLAVHLSMHIDVDVHTPGRWFSPLK